ncbi:aspartic peptidase domain-containing protein [Xylariomycetidae sp. FL0641]|nr:aspartic peptidase domain-containing protein [Xylariomycetidae sp. FL0641]
MLPMFLLPLLHRLLLLLLFFLRCGATATTTSLPSFLDPSTVGERRTDGVGKPLAPAGTRHIKAALQRQRLNVTPSFPAHAPRWERQGLLGFGAGIVYMVELYVGTPNQKISLILDTGSFTMLVDPDCVRAADVAACQGYGYYNTSTSATARVLNANFQAQFGTGYMEGIWYNDTVSFGQNNLPLPNSRVGVNTWSDYMWAGVLGVSYGLGWNTNYPTLIDLLVGEGYIEVPIFSVGVGYQGGGTSSDIIFGGVDRYKFRGYLEPLELFPRPSIQLATWNQVGYWINITSFGISPPDQDELFFTDDSFERMMLVDSGSTYTYLDAGLVATVAGHFNATIDQRGVYYVACDHRQRAGTVNFGFNKGNMVIRVSYSDFIVDFGTYCALGVQPAEDTGTATWILGNSFMRAAYIVFDQLNEALWLAQYMPCQDEGVTDLTPDAGRELWLDITGLC